MAIPHVLAHEHKDNVAVVVVEGVTKGMKLLGVVTAEKRVLVLLYRGCIAYEVQLAAELAHATHAIETSSPRGEDVALGNGMRARADVALEEADASRYDAVLVPGGDPAELVETGAATPLDQVLTSLLNTLGIGLGQADSWVSGVRCGGAVLIQ